MANKIVSRDNFIATIGYDRAVSVVSKSEVAGLKGKSFDEILASGNFRQAAACAIYGNGRTLHGEKVGETFRSCRAVVQKSADALMCN